MRHAAPALAMILAALLLAGCTLPGASAPTPAAEDDPDTNDAGPFFRFIIENGSPRDALAHLRVMGPLGGLDVEGTVAAPANDTTEERVPLARNGTHRAHIGFSLPQAGENSAGRAEAIFDNADCAGTVVVTLRLTMQPGDDRVHGGATSVCVPR